MARKWLIANPRSPLAVPNLSGRLKEHYATCPGCDGEGGFIGDDNTGEYESCEDCEGEGLLFWGCWYGNDYGDCVYCGEHDVLLADIFEHYGQDSDFNYVCLPCYLKYHKDQCGCDLWDWAEKLILGVLVGEDD